jgi:hypothetical protein
MKLKLRKQKEKKPGIQRRMAGYYSQYTGTLPAAFGTDQDALSAKVVIEGSMEVGWRLLQDARTEKNHDLERALRESFIAARKRLNVLIELMETEKGGITIG